MKKVVDLLKKLRNKNLKEKILMKYKTYQKKF